MSEDTKLAELIINTLSPEQMPEVLSDEEIYLVEDDAEYATVEELATKQDIITDLDTIRTNIATNTSDISYLDEKVKEIELFKFPNAIITGNPTIESGQVSSFSNADFLQFPFLVDLTNRRFRAEFCFTTGDDVTTQQNVLDSEFGLALAIKNGKGLMAIGHNGTSWAGQVVGSFNIQPRTTYYANLTWSRINYQTQLSTNGTDYTVDMNFGSTQSPYPRTMFIGGSPDLFGPGTAHPFKGSINLNKCFLYIEEQLVWQGMDDAGLATRADVSLDNLDAAGQAKFDAKQDTLVSGTNIKTINNESILGEGNLDVKGGFDFEGTLAEYEQAQPTLADDAKCLITDDVGSIPTEITQEQLNDKADRDLSNVLANIDYVVESKMPTSDDPTWYRIYKSGWVEQGGRVMFVEGTINLIKEMEDDGYSIILSGYGPTTGSGNDHSCSVFARDITVNNFNVYRLARNEVFNGLYWQVSGKGAN